MDKNQPRSRRKTIKAVDATGNEEEVEKKKAGDKKVEGVEKEAKEAEERKGEIQKEGLDVNEEQRAAGALALTPEEAALLQKGQEDRQRSYLEEQQKAVKEHEDMKQKEMQEKNRSLEEYNRKNMGPSDNKATQESAMKNNDIANNGGMTNEETKDNTDFNKQKETNSNVIDGGQETKNNEANANAMGGNKENTVNKNILAGGMNNLNDKDGENTIPVPDDAQNYASGKEQQKKESGNAMLAELNGDKQPKESTDNNFATTDNKGNHVKIDEDKNQKKYIEPSAGTEFSQNENKEILQNGLEKEQENKEVVGGVNASKENQDGTNDNKGINKAVVAAGGVAAGAAAAGGYAMANNGVGNQNNNGASNQNNNGANDQEKQKKEELLQKEQKKRVEEKAKLEQSNTKFLAAGLAPSAIASSKTMRPITDENVEKEGAMAGTGTKIDTENIKNDSEIGIARNNSQIIYEGDIFKKRYFLSCCWHERYFVLTKDGMLKYYRDKNKEGKGNINVVNIRDLARLDEIGDKYPYKIMLRYQDREDFLGFKEEPERDRWAAKLGEARRNLL
ncbi:hypothetical protein COBT_001379 [Conglomerata obtusa]